MQYCRRCKIWVRNPQTRCPLCQGTLEGDAEGQAQMFPDLERETSRINLGFRIFSFLCIAVCVTGFSLNWIMGFHPFWSGYVLAGVACMWILSAVGLKKRRNLFKNTLWEEMVLWAAFLFWDLITGWRGWSVDFGIPVVVLVVYVILWVLVIVLRAPVSHYMIYMVLASLTSLLPLVLLLCNAVQIRFPSVLCVAGAVLMLSALAIFKGRALWEELKKKTHL